jgi:hypothetical protein
MAAITRIRIDIFECLAFMRFRDRLGTSVIIEANWSEDCRSISDVGKFRWKVTEFSLQLL